MDIDRLRALEEHDGLEQIWIEIAQEVVITTAGPNDEHVFFPAYLELSNGDRIDYLEAVVPSLAHALRRAALVWAMLDAEPPEHWLEHRDDGGNEG